MTLPLELGGIENPDVRRAFEQVSVQFPLHAPNIANDVLLLATTGTKRKVAFGNATLSFVASATASLAVAHGLAVTPVVALGTIANSNGSIIVCWSARDATNVTWFGRQFQNAAFTGSVDLDWLAIG